MICKALWAFVGVALFAGCQSDSQLSGVDTTAQPLLTLDNPAAAAFLSDGQIPVSGEAEALTDVTVNGQPATLSTGGYASTTTLTRGVNIVEARGTDELGNHLFVRHGVLAGQYGNASQPIDNALDLRVNKGGLRDILDAASDMLTPQTVADQISNPVYTTSYDVQGTTVADLSASVTQIGFDRLSIEVTPMDGELYISVWVPNLYVGLEAAGSAIGIDYSTDATLWADRVELGGYATVDAQNGHLVVGWDRSAVNLIGFGYNIDFVPDQIEQATVIDGVMQIVDRLLADQLDQQLPSLLEQQLSQLGIDFQTDVQGKTLTVHGDFASASVDPDGIALGLDLDVNMPGSTHGAPGYLTAPAGTPTLDASSDLSVALSDDLLNRTMFEAWGAKLLDMQLSTDDGSLDPHMLTPLGASQGTIKTRADLPPVIVQKDHGLQMQIGELDVQVDTPDGDLGTHLDAAVAVYANLNLSVHNGTLRLDIGTPDLVMQVRDSDWGASDEATTALLEQMLPIDSLMSLLGSIQLPLPSLGGLTVQQASVTRDPSGVSTGVDITLGR